MKHELRPLQKREENPNGLHMRYIVSKANGDTMNPNAEYFILRLDHYGNDPKHISACRKAVMTYAKEIKDHLPQLSKDLIERYSEESTPKIEAEGKGLPTEIKEYCKTIRANYSLWKGYQLEDAEFSHHLMSNLRAIEDVISKSLPKEPTPITTHDLREIDNDRENR